ncbi:fucolectin [Pimephales promelas]|nr:fucolectin [Pimephales promelas]KAG1937939.1 fucolectin [Pimephales promelas]
MKKLFKCLWILLGFVLIVEKANGQEENAALWGETTQSSIYPGFNTELALDGLIDTFTHTNSETDPWWRVDLLKVYSVNRVTIINRNTFPSRIDGAVIHVGIFPDIYSNTICGVISSLEASATATFSCGGMVGRYMVVHIPGNDKILSLAEVGVYGDLAGNRAVRGAATQSSTSGDWFAEKAIDSNRGLQQLYTGCSSTLNQTNPWWRLDLHDMYRVSKVVITNRRDCCAERINGAEIRIGNSLENNGSNNPICAVIPAIPAGESYNYLCGGMDGRYVNLIVPGDMKTLSLCELEVYGEGPCLKGSFVKMQFNSGNDLTDPSMREDVLKQLGSALADRGLTDVTLRWTQTPERVIQKGNDDKRPCENRKSP